MSNIPDTRRIISSVRDGLITDLEAICPGAVELDVSLARVSRWRIGGLAAVVVGPSSVRQILALRSYLSQRSIPHVVIGGTTNLLFADEGLQVPCIQISERMSKIAANGETIVAEAGAWVPGLARRAMQAGLSGVEHICGIPGTVGGLICMNGGSQRKGVGSSVGSVTSVNEAGELVTRSGRDCEFAYRASIFQRNGEIVAQVELRLAPAPEKGNIRREMLDILASRRRKFPQKDPNCGSVFKSDDGLYADYGPPGALIERLGFKGRRIGGAEVSPNHANFISNRGGALAIDVLTLISEIRAAVLVETGYQLRTEARFVTANGQIIPADQASEMI